MTIQMIVTADDCGLSEGINRAVADLHERGMVSAASIMTNFPAAQHALSLFRQYPTLELGVHLTLSDGRPLAPTLSPSDLTEADGRFRNQFMLYAQSFFPSPSLRRSIRRELRAQIDFCVDAGVLPSHLTTHCHFHAIPAMREIVHELAQEYDVHWVRTASYRSAVVPLNPLLALNSPASMPQGGPFVIPDYLVGLKHWLGNPPEAMLDEICKLDGIVELIVHPGQAGDATYPDSVRYPPVERDREARYLADFYRLMQADTRRDIVIRNLRNNRRLH